MSLSRRQKVYERPNKLCNMESIARDSKNVIDDLARQDKKFRSITVFNAHKNDVSNIEDYWPQTVSIGPYHHGGLNDMETHKNRAVERYLKIHDKSIHHYKNYLLEKLPGIKSAYENFEICSKEEEDRFLSMLVTDGIFLLVLLGKHEKRYSQFDPIYGSRGAFGYLPKIKRDLLLLENQIPMVVLKMIKEVSTGIVEDIGEINARVLKFFNIPRLEEMPLDDTYFHILDLIRHRMLYCSDLGGFRPMFGSHNLVTTMPTNDIMRYSLHELQDMHVKVQVVTKDSAKSCLRYVAFSEDNILKLPHIHVNEQYSKSLFLNLAMFENCHGGIGYDINEYLSLMTALIRSEIDVGTLISKGVIVSDINRVGKIHSMFEDIAKHDLTTMRHTMLHDTRRDLNKHCKRVLRSREGVLYKTAKAFKKSYRENMLGSIGFIVNSSLLVTAIVSTVYTVKAYFKLDPCSCLPN